ncbi:MAG: sugar ABC transporter permease [Solirubrobacteraceae bacterium]
MSAHAQPAARPIAPSGKARRGGGQARAERRLGYALVAPVVILLLAVTAYPLLYNLWNSFHRVNLSIANQPRSFIGFDNYTKMFGSSEWVTALERTAAFTVVSVVLETIAALGLALMLNRNFRGRGFLRAAILVPWAVPTVVSATLWKTMFDPRAGFVDYLLSGLHLPGATTTWLAGVWTSWAAILVADAWKNVPFIAIILLAGLQVIPSEVYEAARMDGASQWQSFRRMTLPLLKPALGVALIFRTLQAFLVFDVIYIMTGGGPGVSTETLSFLNWQTFLVSTDFGYGGAISVMLVIISLIIAAIYVRVLRPEQMT